MAGDGWRNVIEALLTDARQLGMLLLMATLASAGAMIGALAVALAPVRWRERLLPALVAFAAGSMLGAALMGMLPMAMHRLPEVHAGVTVLGALLFFFLLERLSLWHHCHDPQCELRRGTGRVLLIGDAFHNATDGVVIAAAFLTSPLLGWSATLAVMAHEIPQEMGDHAVLIESGLSRWQALGWNLVSALSTLPGALLGYLLLQEAQVLMPYAMAISGASFLYIALGDLMPRLHSAQHRRWLDPALLLLGVASTAWLRLSGH